MELKMQFQLAYGIPSMCLYGVIFVVLISKRRTTFNASFWHLFFVLGIVECLCWIITCFLFRFPGSGALTEMYLQLPSKNWLLGKLMFAGYYIHLTQEIANLSISFNRFTAIVFPSRYEQIWKRAVPITIAVIFLLPLLATWHLLTSNGTFATKDNKTFTMSVSGGVPWSALQLSNNVVSMVSGGVMACGCLVLNIWAGTVLFNHRQSFGHNLSKSPLVQAEINLFLLGLIMFVSQLALICFDILIEVFTRTRLNDAFQITYNQLGWLVDFACISNPWLILIASHTLRNEVFKLLFGKLFVSKSNTITPAINSRTAA